MKFRVTSVASDETAEALRTHCSQIEEILTESLASTDFGKGIDQLSLVIVSVDSDGLENRRWSNPYDRLGVFSDPATGQRVRYLSISAPVAPEQLLRMSAPAQRAMIDSVLLGRLTERPKRLPRNYFFQGLASAVSAAIAADSGAVA